MGSGRRGGSLSIGTIIFLVVIYFVLKMMGIDMLQVLDETGLPVRGMSSRRVSGRLLRRRTK